MHLMENIFCPLISSARFRKEKVDLCSKLFMNFESRYFGRDDPLPMALGKSLRRLGGRT